MTVCLVRNYFFTADSLHRLVIKNINRLFNYVAFAGSDVPDGAEDFLNMVVRLCKESGNDWYRVYLIRKLSEWQGVEFVLTLVKQPEFNWLFPAEIHQQVHDHP